MIIMNLIGGTLLLLCVFLAFRNSRVHNFRSKIIDIVFEGDDWKTKLEIYHNGPSYKKMLLSIKPLKLESFYTEKQIGVLTKNK